MRLLSIVVSAPVLVAIAASAAQASGVDPPPPSDLLQQRADEAVAVVAKVQTGQYLAIGAAVLAFVVAAVVIWLWSSRWVKASLLQWLVLLVVPVALAIGVTQWRAGDIHGRLEQLRVDALKQIPNDQELGANAGYVKAAYEALSLKTDDDHGNLRSALALTPALLSAAISLVLLVGVWGWSNRRVLRSA